MNKKFQYIYDDDGVKWHDAYDYLDNINAFVKKKIIVDSDGNYEDYFEDYEYYRDTPDPKEVEVADLLAATV